MGERRFRILLAICVALVTLSTHGVGAAPRTAHFVPTAGSIVKAMAVALGGSARIAKIHTLFFEWHVHGVTAGGTNLHQHIKEWLTVGGEDRMEAVTAAMQGAPLLRVFLPGMMDEPLSVTITDSGKYYPPSNDRTCSSPSGGVCVDPSDLYLDLASGPRSASVPIDVSENGYSGAFIESDTCAGIATIARKAGGNNPALFSLTPKHAGHCTVTFSSSSPEGWTLEGDEGWPSGDSSGALQGPDLAREISYVYWMTFAYMHGGALPGTVRYVPVYGADRYQLDLQPQGGEPIVAEIDTQTFLPKSVLIGNDHQQMLVIPHRWKATNGVLFPTKMTVKIVDEQLQMEYSLVRIGLNQKFAPSLFAQPTPSI